MSDKKKGSKRKEKISVTVGLNPAVKNPQWTRVHGADIEPGHDARCKLNVARMADQAFTKACEVVGVKVTRRQASKWNNKGGAAYNVANRIEMNGYVYPEAI